MTKTEEWESTPVKTGLENSKPTQVQTFNVLGRKLGIQVSHQEAELLFIKLKQEGFAAFKTEGGKDGVLIQEYDPTASEVLFVPQIVGG